MDLFWTFQLSGTSDYMAFVSVFFTYVNVFKTRQHASPVIRVAAFISTMFLFTADYYSIVCVDHILFIRSSVGGIWIVSAFWLL